MVYCALQVGIFLTHEPFRDEAQAWLVAKEMAWPGGFFVIPGEGHPPLWFWLLRGLSFFFDFDTARLFSVGIAMLNAVLLFRLLRNDLVILCLLLVTQSFLQYWGYYFRPYGLILTCVLAALLLARNGRHAAAHWVMALSCGLHFLSGLLFAFWLVLAIRDRRPLVELAGPVVLAALFGLSAVLSASGNAQSAFDSRDYLAITEVFSWPFAQWGSMTIVGAAATIALLVGGLWREPLLLTGLLLVILAMAAFSTLIYRIGGWHVGFMLSLFVMAFVGAGAKGDTRFLAPLLLVQAGMGLWHGGNQLVAPQVSEAALYSKLVENAGPDFVPERQLVGWPDFVLSATAARHDLSYVSGTTGARLGSVDYRAFTAGVPAVTDSLASLAVPYWLVCFNCEAPLDVATRGGREATVIDTNTNAVGEPLSIYRIDAAP